MATEIFDAPTFVAALVAALPSVKWEALGLLDNEQTWRCFPCDDKPFSVQVRSSIGPSGLCDGAGDDSIRANIMTEDGEFWGGKAKRWVPRTTNWRTMLAELLGTLAGQVERITPCPSCGTMVKPFVVKKAGPTKGRPFVKCCNDACEKQAFVWCDVDEAPAVAPAPLPAPVAPGSDAVTVKAGDDDSLPTNADGVPLCPHHGPMVRMSSDKGWRCSEAGRWNTPQAPRRWSNCNVSQFDDRKKCKKEAPAPVAAPAPVVPPRAVKEAPAPVAAPVVRGPMGTNGPKMVTVPLSLVRAAMGALDDDNPGEVARILGEMIKMGN